jgi:hypothetical protein
VARPTAPRSSRSPSRPKLRRPGAAAAAVKANGRAPSPPPLGAGGVEGTIRARLPCSAKYAVHLQGPAPHPGAAPVREAATVVAEHVIATFAHGAHAEWREGQRVQVRGPGRRGLWGQEG